MKLEQIQTWTFISLEGLSWSHLVSQAQPKILFKRWSKDDQKMIKRWSKDDQRNEEINLFSQQQRTCCSLYFGNFSYVWIFKVQVLRLEFVFAGCQMSFVYLPCQFQMLSNALTAEHQLLILFRQIWPLIFQTNLKMWLKSIALWVSS